MEILSFQSKNPMMNSFPVANIFYLLLTLMLSELVSPVPPNIRLFPILLNIAVNVFLSVLMAGLSVIISVSMSFIKVAFNLAIVNVERFKCYMIGIESYGDRLHKAIL